MLTKKILKEIIDISGYNKVLSCKSELDLGKCSGTIVITDIEKVDINNLLKKLNKNIKNNKYILCINEDIDKNDNYKSVFKDFVKINLNTVSRYTNHLITADFADFDFSELYEENERENSKGILWDNSKVELDKQYNKIVSIYQHHRFNIGDNVYVFYTNLPDNTKKILLKCLVVNNGYYNENFKMERCWYEGMRDTNTYISKEDKFPGIRLVIDKSINYKTDKNEFDEQHLLNSKNGYGLKNIQGKQYLTYNENKVLIEKLKERIDKLKDILKKYKEYFFHECELKNCKEIKSNHEMFKTSKGPVYFENHHLVPQSEGERDKALKDGIVNQKFNKFKLCLTCHKRIHYGTKADSKAMIEYLYNLRKDELKKAIIEYDAKLENKELKWIKGLYNVAENEN